LDLGQTAQDTYHDIVINGPLKVGKLIGALHDAIGGNDVMAVSGDDDHPAGGTAPSA